MKKFTYRLLVFSRKTLILFVSLVVISSSVLGFFKAPKALASGNPTFIGGSAVSGAIGQTTDITDLQVSGSGNPNIPMTLRVSHGTLHMTDETGLSFTGSDNAATLAFSGNLSDVNTDLATLQYTGNALGSDTLEASMVGANEVYDPDNGHVYEFVDGPVTWDDAFTAASTYTYNGLTGYLATVTSSDENAYLTARLPDGGWIGASDAAQEGQWKWIDGPENGTLFYTGNGGDGSGAQVSGQYSNWNSGEPNNSGGDENCAQFLSGSTGLWNDLECNSETLPYVVEFGGPSSLPSVAFKTVSITNNAPTETAANCSQLQSLDDNPGSQYANITLTHDIDCTGYTVDPLFSSNAFTGTFNGQGHTISHLDYEHPSDGEVALIASTGDGATIENLNLTDGTVKGSYYVGSFVGNAEGSLTLNNVTSDLTISGDCSEYGGGLVGGIFFSSGQTINISNSSMTGEDDCYGYAGGLVGYIESGSNGTATFTNDFNSGDLNTTQNGEVIGGIIGDLDSEPGTIIFNNVYNQGNVNAPNSDYVGGIAGIVEGYDEGPSGQAIITIENAYNSGAISGSQYVGGLIGSNYAIGSADTIETIQNTFNAGGLASGDSTTTGAIIGQSEVDNSSYSIASINNYYDATADTGFNCSPVNSISDCNAIDTSAQPNYFKSNHINQPMHSWNFSSIWQSNLNSYPTFGQGGDTDGIPDSVENAGPNNGDANNDGILDSQQDNVASFVDSSTGKYVVLQVPDSCSINSVNTEGEASNNSNDSGFNYPLGMMNFTISCTTAGYTATISQYYYGASGSYVLRKFNSHSNAYYSVSGASYQSLTIGGKSATKVTYQITDGGSSDEDGAVNGTIVDPVGMGVANVSVPNTGLGPMTNKN